MKKFNAFMITASTFIFWYLFSFFSNYLTMLENNTFLKALIASIFSYAIYKGFVFFIIFLGNQCEKIKRIILGNEYLNGKWIGYYHGVSGKIRYFIETIEQDMDGIIIRGNSFDENMEFHSSWNSEAVNINGKTGILTYTYSVSGKGSDDDGLGMARFSFVRKNSKDITKSMNGFSTDLKYGERIKSYEEKISNNITDNELLIKAKGLYLTKTNGT